MEVELIRVKIPPDDGHQILLPTFKWSGSQEDLEHEIEKKLSIYGPLHRISVHRSRDHPIVEEGETWFAYASFYSTWDCKTAIRDGKVTIEGNKVCIRRKGTSKAYEDVPLSLHKAQGLITHYFGFNCWTSDVVYLERDTDTECAGMLRFVCLVRVKLPKEDLCSEGVGVGEAPLNADSPSSRGCSFSCARRFAFQSAMKAAFSKFVIIRLQNGKVTAEVDTTQCDPLLYNPAWDNPVVQVNEVTHDPEYEDDTTGLEDISEEELLSLLNTTVT